MTTHSASNLYEQLEDKRDSCAPNPADYPERPETSRSYWQSEHHDAISQGCDVSALPSAVDVVIIGSGVTGAAVAYNLAKQLPNLQVAVLEARGFCSGATGRNGGHISRPEAFDFGALSESLGLEDAVKVKHMWNRNRDILVQTVEELGVADQVNMRLSGTIDVFKNEKQLNDYKTDHEAAVQNGFTPEATLMPADEARKFLGLPESFPVAGAAYLKKSGTIWPRKLVECVFRGAQERMAGLSIHTYTPVTSVDREEAGDGENVSYRVTTSKGHITARAVFHATNAYVSHLVPSLAGENGVYGAKCHVMAIQPNTPASQKASTTQLPPGFGYDAFWHWIAQVPSFGPFVYGYSWTTTLHDFDDTVTYPPSIPGRDKMYEFLESAFPAAFDKINGSRDVAGDWTGIMGFTAKGTSVVGKVSKDSPGEFLSVGHNGEGMSRCFACAEFASEALIAYLKGDASWTPPTWFPKSYSINV